MTGPQLSKWRSDHDLALREVVEMLGGQVNHTTVSRWERQPDDIPTWAAEKILATTQITLPLDELHALLDAAREDNTPAQQFIAQAILEYLHKRRLTKSQVETPTSPAGPAPSTIYTLRPDDLKVAEDPIAATIGSLTAQLKDPKPPKPPRQA